jgi:2-isopropylmalate synthase
MPASRIDIYDTTLRDGTQGEGFNLSLRDKLLIAQKLDDFGVDYIEGGFPASNPKDAAFFTEAARLRFRRAKLSAFGMTRRRGVKASEDPGIRSLLAAETPVITFVGKSSRFQVEKVLAVSREENLAMIGESVEMAVRAGKECVYDAEHFFDAYAAEPDFALGTLKAAHDAGASVLVLCDTNGGTMPEQVATAVRAVRERLPAARVGIHTHNDSGLAVASALAAVLAGATHAQGTINGVGERCGNMDLTTLIANLKLKYKFDLLEDASLAKLSDLSRYVYDLSNTTPITGQPYTGPSAFAHKGGMHVHAVQKDASTYEHVDPAAVGNVRKILISELSGASNIAATVGRKLGLEHDKGALRRVLEKVCDLENKGYAFEVAEASFELLARREVRPYPAFFTLGQYRVEILRQGNGDPISEATVKLEVPRTSGVRHEVAEGDGPVAAIDAALRKALLPAYPSLDRLHLMDYKVRVVSVKSGADEGGDASRSETSAMVRVIAAFRRQFPGEHSRPDELFGTVGVSGNIIDASFQALRDAFEYHLLQEKEGGAQ